MPRKIASRKKANPSREKGRPMIRPATRLNPGHSSPSSKEMMSPRRPRLRTGSRTPWTTGAPAPATWGRRCADACPRRAASSAAVRLRTPRSSGGRPGTCPSGRCLRSGGPRRHPRCMSHGGFLQDRLSTTSDNTTSRSRREEPARAARSARRTGARLRASCAPPRPHAPHPRAGDPGETGSTASTRMHGCELAMGRLRWPRSRRPRSPARRGRRACPASPARR